MAMASQDVNANSRLAEMQMKFQKKQKLERERKKMALTGGDISQTSKSTNGSGKVRQMFDDRRRGVGIDRSHPLRPIATSTISTTVVRPTKQQAATNKLFDGEANVTRRQGFTNTTSMQPSKTINRSNLNNTFSISNGNINVFRNNFDEVDNLDNETFPKEFSSLSLNNTHIMGSHVTNDPDFDNNNKGESSILGGTIVINKKISPKTNGIQLNPIITKKTPTTTAPARKTINKTAGSSSRVSTLSKTTATTSSKKYPPPPKAPTNKTVKASGIKTRNTKPATFVMSVKPPPRISTPPTGMASCQYCQRHFIEERLVKHEEVCKKMMTTKRKIFDASKHRVKGTEAESYLKKGKGLNTTVSKAVPAVVSTLSGSKNTVEKKSNWRKKHEDFIAAIREAKKVKAHLAKGGKLSDLPPPPPSENPDYIQCPHCSRRFNESAAERHIPKCANMQHNKPKPAKKRL